MTFTFASWTESCCELIVSQRSEKSSSADFFFFLEVYSTKIKSLLKDYTVESEVATLSDDSDFDIIVIVGK